MKKVSKTLSLLLIPILFSCGGSGEADSENTDSDENGETTETTTESESMYGDIEGLKGQTSYTNEELCRLTNFLSDEVVTLTGYPYAYPSSEGTEIEFKPNSTRMIIDINNSLSSTDIDIRFKDETDMKMLISGDLFAVKGKLTVDYRADEKWGNETTISLRDAEFIEVAEDTKGSISSVADIDVSKQIFSGDLYAIMDKHFTDIFDKGNIQISGNYNGTTVSRGTDGEITESRVDLGSGDFQVGCELIDEPDTDALGAIRDAGKQVVIEGVFSRAGYYGVRITKGVIK